MVLGPQTAAARKSAIDSWPLHCQTQPKSKPPPDGLELAMQLRHLTLLSVVMACVAFNAAATYVDTSLCYDEGQNGGREVEKGICAAVLASCKGGAKAPSTPSAKNFDRECTRQFYSGCVRSDLPAPSGSPCKGTYAGDATCTTKDFEALFAESVKGMCADRATKFVFRIYDAVGGQLACETTGKELPAGAPAPENGAGSCPGSGAQPGGSNSTAGAQAPSNSTAGAQAPAPAGGRRMN